MISVIFINGNFAPESKSELKFGAVVAVTSSQHILSPNGITYDSSVKISPKGFRYVMLFSNNHR